jgi:hypothetical protein
VSNKENLKTATAIPRTGRSAQPGAAKLLAAILACAFSALVTPSAPAAAQQLAPAEARAIAKEATIYGFPLVDNYRVQYSYFVDRGSDQFKAPWNTLSNTARVFTPADTAIQTPNSDTPYSALGADLRAEPLVISVPAIDKDRYYSLQFVDMYTFDFAYVGSRTTGNDAGDFLLAGPDWHGDTPPGIEQVIRSETEFAFVLYRTQLFGPDDIDNVKQIQAGYKVQPLSQFLAQPAPSAAPPVDFVKPLTPEAERTSPEFFNILNFVLGFCPPNPAETDIMARFAKLGIGPHGTFDAKALSPEMLKAVQDGMADAWATFKTYKETELDTGKLTSANAFGTREFLNGDYLARFSGAVLGIYGNSKDEAIYPLYFVDSAKKPLSGANRYELRFAPGDLPPVNAFWSLTLYELPSSLLSANPLNRYLINSPMLPGLKRDDDGGITLVIQHANPGPDEQANWLPARAGPFFLAMRLYWPKAAALDGRWMSPPLIQASENEAAAAPAASAPAPVPAPAPAPAAAPAPSAPIPVTPDNFVRAESDRYLGNLAREGGVGKFFHRREPAAINNQTVIRLNRDTLYSSAVFDLDAGPVTITLPDPGKRFMSMQVIDEDEYTPEVDYGAGTYTLTKEKIGARYVVAAVRLLVDPNDPKDLDAVHALQDAIKVDQPGGPGTFETPHWDQASQKTVRDGLLTLATTLPDTKGMFGPRGDVDNVRHLIGAASAWGGNPEKDALYLNVVPAKNDGKSVYRLNVKDVPVDGFWSVSVYNAKGYFEPNPQNAYTLNNITATPSADGSIDIQFGGCDGGSQNCLPTPPGWNYLVRLYRPRPEILDGSWTFPTPQAANK